jgi:hypothetical protein
MTDYLGITFQMTRSVFNPPHPMPASRIPRRVVLDVVENVDKGTGRQADRCWLENFEWPSKNTLLMPHEIETICGLQKHDDQISRLAICG